MHLMQYEVALPADYDMGIIRHRVATRGHLLDDAPGLGIKAYCIRERGAAGSNVNEYAPFYVWARPDAMTSFLFGPGFRGLCDSFGRPRVKNWVGIGFHPGATIGRAPIAASRQVTPISPDEILAETVERALATSTALQGEPGLHSTTLAINPDRWELVRFSLWNDESSNRPGTCYRVLHLSTPAMTDLPATVKA